MRRAHVAVALVIATGSSLAHAATYRCEADGKVVYGDKPCTSGRQSEVDIVDQRPMALDRAAAEQRARNDKSEAARLAAEREKREKVDGVDAKRLAARTKQQQACARMEVRVRRLKEDAASTGPRDTAARRRLARAEEDAAAACRG